MGCLAKSTFELFIKQAINNSVFPSPPCLAIRSESALCNCLAPLGWFDPRASRLSKIHMGCRKSLTSKLADIRQVRTFYSGSPYFYPEQIRSTGECES